MADRGHIKISVDKDSLIYEFNKKDVIYTKTILKREWNADMQKYDDKVDLYIYLSTQKDPVGISITVSDKTSKEDAIKYVNYFKEMCR